MKKKILYLLQGLELSSQKWYTRSYTHLPRCWKTFIRTGTTTGIPSLVCSSALKTHFDLKEENHGELDLQFLTGYSNPYVIVVCMPTMTLNFMSLYMENFLKLS